MKTYIKNTILTILSVTTLNSQAFDANTLLQHVKSSIVKADKGESKLNQDILNIFGYSSSKGRHLLNNLCALPDASYLEIGAFKGSTFISAVFNNWDTLKSALAIDNWSEFGGRHEFHSNVSAFLPSNAYTVYDHNCYTLNIKEVFKNKIDIYFYDGNHTFESQRLAFTYYDEILADTFIAIVDDWNWDSVSGGTKKAFEQLNYTVLYEINLPAYLIGDKENWWNGFYVAVIQKKK